MTNPLRSIGVAGLALRVVNLPGDGAWFVLACPSVLISWAVEELDSELDVLTDTERRLITPVDGRLFAAQLSVRREAIFLVRFPLDAAPDLWEGLDRLRSRLAHPQAIVLVLSFEQATEMVERAPNLTSWVGGTMWQLDADADALSHADVEERLGALRAQHGLTDEQVIEQATRRQLGADMAFVEWLVLLGRGILLTLISPEERLSALQARCCDPEPELEAQTPKRLFQQLRKRLLEAHERDGVLASSWNDVLGLVKISPRPEKLGDHDVFLITGGMKNQHRDPKIAHLRRTDGAWFDFSVAVSSRRGPLRLIGYNFELRFPEPARVRWIRYDLSPPGHPNDARDLRSHMHPGDDDIQLPAPMMSPLELLDLFLVWTPLPERPQHG